jgi:hypothetical protein
MFGTSKELRAQPTKIFEDYTLTRVLSEDSGLSNTPPKAFFPAGPASLETAPMSPGISYHTGAISDILDIGFEFEFDQITYKKFVVATNGWMALVDPSLGTFTSSNISPSVATPARLRTTFTGSHVVLAPWYCNSQIAIASNTFITGTGTSASTIPSKKKERISSGLEPSYYKVNENEYAVRYAYDKGKYGRRLVVRWNTFLSTFVDDKHLRYEVVLNENGRIEFNYGARDPLNIKRNTSQDSSVATIGSTIGVIKGATRFRDFSYGLGQHDNDRQQYALGGAIYTSSYVDTLGPFSTYYNVTLSSSLHWPALNNVGCSYIFAPPVNRKKVLPRNELRLRDKRQTFADRNKIGANRRNRNKLTFDDRKTLLFTTTGSMNNVNYPTNLHRFYGEPGTLASEIHDLFNEDTLFVGTTPYGTIDDSFIHSNEPMNEKTAFNESSLYENDPANVSDDFFISGSSITQFGLNLKQPLKSKTKLKLSFPINVNCRMMPTASAIYYYNQRSGSWGVPLNSTYLLDDNDAIPSNNTNGDISFLPGVSEINYNIAEDSKAFGPIGNFISSGSKARTSPSVRTNSSDQLIGANATTTNVNLALNTFFSKSVTVNQQYFASNDELVTVDIQQPFIIEKAIFEIPIAFGDGWFQDNTTAFTPIVDNGSTGWQYSTFEFLGPGLTVSLFRQTVTSEGTIRDLILTGTITHAFDVGDPVKLRNYVDVSGRSASQFSTNGFIGHGAKPGAIVMPMSSSTVGYYMTGSVTVRCEAQVSNGIIAWLEMLTPTTTTSPSTTSGIYDILNSEYVTFDSGTIGAGGAGGTGLICTRIAQVSNFGRSKSGFVQSPRSVFGNEFTTLNATTLNRVKNPFYVSGANGTLNALNYATFISGGVMPSSYETAIITSEYAKLEAAIPLLSFAQSPYMLLPGDKLIVAISKTRPFSYSSGLPSGTISHDVSLLTGAINLTMYGSTLVAGVEKHDTLEQRTVTNSIHEVIGDDPIFDQIESFYGTELSGSIFDAYMTGSMFLIDNSSGTKTIVVSDNRKRAFSKNNARSYGSPSSGSDGVSYNSQPWWERSGMLGISQYVDSIERYWDSMPPSISEVLAADQKYISIPVNYANIPWSIGSFGSTGSFGVIYLNLKLTDDTFNATCNSRWQNAFPFEPHYASANRQKDIKNSYNAKLKADIALNSGSYIPTRKVDGLIVGIFSHYDIDSDSTIEGVLDLYSDRINSTTGSMSTVDVSKVLFGFGDHKTYSPASLDSSGITLGANNFPNVRSYATAYQSADTVFRFVHGPISRGWKYGILSGLPTYSKSYFRTNRYGQIRDMLEQRQISKFYLTPDSTTKDQVKEGVGSSVVIAKFIDFDGKVTNPENTWSSNLSFEATSSLPYFDGIARNRNDINIDTLNSSIITFDSQASL